MHLAESMITLALRGKKEIPYYLESCRLSNHTLETCIRTFVDKLQSIVAL